MTALLIFLMYTIPLVIAPIVLLHFGIVAPAVVFLVIGFTLATTFIIAFWVFNDIG